VDIYKDQSYSENKQGHKSNLHPQGDSTIQITTKQGKAYVDTVRKLYYNLLTSGIPPAKVAPTIKEVLRHLLPSNDVTKLNLSKASTANYMRKEELRTICDVHKASELCNADTIHMNTDGTTLGQHKIAATSINGLVLSVNEVPNGSAEEIAKDISQELERLRRIAHEIGLGNADSINWSLVASSTSDCAATQKKFNKIAQKLKDEDTKQFGHTSVTAGHDILSNFCAMHLGINLRRAFWQGSEHETKSAECTTGRHYFVTDTTVHEFCKVFGTTGVNECGVGVLTFPDFLPVNIQTEKSDKLKKDYYEKCTQIHLARQVGSRYFVSAYNAAKIIFLRMAALERQFKRNKLEKEVYAKLQDPSVITSLKADGLMFLHIYADLTCLAKSTELKKSAMDMNLHYLELDGFLEYMESSPSIVFDTTEKVFKSEPKLYGDGKFNHRLKAENKVVYSHLQIEEKADLQEMLLYTK
jgi:hypothetical protein